MKQPNNFKKPLNPWHETKVAESSSGPLLQSKFIGFGLKEKDFQEKINALDESKQWLAAVQAEKASLAA